jgi:hypothetical protein
VAVSAAACFRQARVSIGCTSAPVSVACHRALSTGTQAQVPPCCADLFYMSASRSFIDVLVGKLTAYVDASSRPAPTIQTPSWVASLNPVPMAAAGAANRAYACQALPGDAPSTPPGATPWSEAAGMARVAHARAATHVSSSTRAVAPSRTAIERTAIRLLRRLGAGEISEVSSDAEIRSSYRRLLRACHPDTHPGASEADRAALTARLRAVIRAWSVFERGCASMADAA